MTKNEVRKLLLVGRTVGGILHAHVADFREDYGAHLDILFLFNWATWTLLFRVFVGTNL